MKSKLAIAAAIGLVAATANVVAAGATISNPGFASASVVATTAVTPNGAWTVYHHDNAHTGFDSTQPTVSTATTGWTSPTLDETVFGEPIVYQGLVYVATMNNTVYALNQTDGSVVWSTNLGTPETGGWICGNVSPQGIHGTPVIDTSTNRIYAAAFLSSDVYEVFGLDLASGNTVFSYPIPTNIGSGFDWKIQGERGALAVANGFVYVPFGGRAGDCYDTSVTPNLPYHGWVVGVPTNGATPPAVYETGGVENGIWSAGGVVVDNSTGKVFVTTGNGGCPTTYNYNDAVVRLSASLGLEDYFAPSDWHDNWSCNDQDLGSASTVLISPNLGFQAGKWGNGFLYNPKSLGGINGQLYPPSTPYTSVDVCLGNNSDANFGSYAYAAPYVYLSCNANTQTGFTGRMVALKIDTSAPSFRACGAGCAAPSWNSGSTTFGPPIVAGGAVWAVDINGGGLYGFDASTGAKIFQSGAFNVNHFSTPSEAGGQIFVSADTTVRSFNMSTACRSIGVSAAPPISASVGTSVTFMAIASGCPNPQYQFWTLAPGASAYTLAQAYSTNGTLIWDTSGKPNGAYHVSVWARDAGSAGVFSNGLGTWDAYTVNTYSLTSADCTGLNVSSAPPSTTSVGSSVTFTATGICPDANPVYQFWIKAPGAASYTLAQAYSTTRTFAWSTAGKSAGTYSLSVWVRDVNSGGAFSNGLGTWDAYNSGTYKLTAPACTGLNISSAPTSETSVGTSVTFTATGTCPDANPTYQFWIKAPGASAYSLAQAYSTTRTLAWNTTGKVPGTYSVSVWVRDASSTGAFSNTFGSWDAYNTSTYRLTGCTAVSVTAAPPSTGSVGTSVTFTATGNCPDANPVYELWILAPGTGAYTLAQAYSTTRTLVWSTAGKVPGTYGISVWVRDANSGGAFSNTFGSWDSYSNSTFKLT